MDPLVCCGMVYGAELNGTTYVNKELVYVYSVAVYQKYTTRLRELIVFEPWRENYHFSQPS